MFAQVISGTVTDRDGLRGQFDRWNDEVRPGATGFLGSTGGITDDGKFIVLARFESSDDARRNSERPEQSSWWAETEKSLRDVEFLDSSDVVMQQGGGSNDAGFVQVMRGRILDEPAYARMMAKMDEFEATMKESRPDVIGGLTVHHDDGRYSDFIYFESEAAARDGETKEMPEEMQKEFEDMMSAVAVDEYLDLTDPWLR